MGINNDIHHWTMQKNFEPKVINNSNEALFCRHTITGTDRNSQSVAAWTRPAKIQARWGPTPKTKMLFGMDVS